MAEGADEVIVGLEEKAAQTLSTAGCSSSASRFFIQPAPPGPPGKSLFLQRDFRVPSSPFHATG